MQNQYRKAIREMALCWLGAATAISAMAQATTVAGVTPGQFSVNESGAATYRIPLQVPPGVAGMEPKLELAYSSQGGNGLLGMGWSLSGLSTISRCPRTMAIDSFRGAVKFDMNDRYCMDGQRLILVSGTYGVAGSEYRTELDSFSRIVASGTAGNGVASFTVQTKAGLTMEYGNTADSRIEAQGKATVRVWALNKISDVKTNYLTVSYYKSTDSSVYAPLTLGYDGNVVSIEYETTRPDRVQGYMAGSLVQVDRRISHIKTHAKGSSDLVFDYKVSYTGGATVQRSVIANISKCERNGNCLSELALTIGNTATVGFTSSNTHLANLSDSAFVHGVGDAGLRVVDLNGDGLPDLLQLGYFVNGEFGGGLIRRAFINTGTGYVRNDAYVSGVSDSAFTHTYSRDAGLRVVDLNGDGLPDLLHLGYFVNGEWGGGALRRAFINTGSGFVQDNTWISNLSDSAFAHSGRSSGLETVDLNGDGVSDLLMLGYFLSGEFGGGAVMRSYLNNGMADYRLKELQQAGATRDITYQPLTKKIIYTKDAAPNAAVYPKIDVQYSMYVVSEVKASNGVGGVNAVQYSYGGLKAELGTGRGMLGFRWMKSKNLTNNIESYTEFNQTWPLTGSVAKSETRLAGAGNAGVLKRTTNTYAQGTGSAAGTTFVYPSQSVEESWDLGGSQYPTVTNSYQYGQSPQYGDPTQISVINSTGAGKTTVNEYWPANTSSSNWILGRLKKATVTSTAP